MKALDAGGQANCILPVIRSKDTYSLNHYVLQATCHKIVGITAFHR